MNDWDQLNHIVSKWDNSSPRPGATIAAFDNLRSVNLSKMVTELHKEDTEKENLRIILFGKLFDIARRALEIDLTHPQLNALTKNSKVIFERGIFLPEAINFLHAILDKYATTPSEAQQTNIAFKALLAGINERDVELANMSMLVLSYLLPKLDKHQRKVLINEVKALPKNMRKASLQPALERYCILVNRAEEMINETDWNIDNASSVISVHSHKGGVGKTMTVTALAVALASKKESVCLVDCDDEGPSLLQSLPFDWEKERDIIYFVDWFDSEMEEIPDGGIPTIKIKNTKIGCIPGSFIASDIARLDKSQRGERPKYGDYKIGLSRIVRLIRHLIEDKKFKHVIIDTGPGIAHLTQDVLLATLSVGGSRIFVMRPRIVDICQLCIDMDWLWWLEKKEGRKASSIVLNFTNPDTDHKDINLMKGEEIAEKISRLKQFQLISARYFSPEKTDKLLKELIRDTWNEFKGKIYEIHELEELRHADSIENPAYSNILDIVKDLPNVEACIKRILKQFLGFKRNL